MLVGLVYPAIRTSMLAFTDAGGNVNGFDNFVWMFTQPEALTTLRNTVIWTVLVPLLSTGFGLAYAVFIDKARGERFLSRSSLCQWPSPLWEPASSGSSSTTTAVRTSNKPV